MKKKIKVALLGGGINSAVGLAHISALRLAGQFDILPSFFSDDARLNIDSHNRYGISYLQRCKNFEDWLEYATNEVDLFIILTPSNLHAEHISRIVDVGGSFITEKPIVCLESELKFIEKKLIDSPTSRAYFVHNYSGYPMYRELRLRLHRGDIGRIHSIRIEMPSDPFAREQYIGPPQQWRQKDPDVPMIMLDLGTHMYHLVANLLPMAESKVFCTCECLNNKYNVIDTVDIYVRRADGISVRYWMSKVALGQNNGLRVSAYGTLGTLEWYQENPDKLIRSDDNSRLEIIHRGVLDTELQAYTRFKAGHPTGFIEAFANYYQDVADSFLGESDGVSKHLLISPMKEGFDCFRFLLAATRSNKLGVWVNL